MNKFLAFVLTLMIFSSCTHIIDENPPVNNPPIVDSTDCDPNIVYFENEVLPIFASSCALSGCHDANSAQEGIVLNNYQNIFVTGEISAGNPNSGDIYESITENDPSKLMPPPSSGITLTSAQIQTIYDWIDQGALNNLCAEEACDSVNVTFAASIQPIINTYCKGCHSGGSPQGGISLENYNQIKISVDNGSLGGSINHTSGFTPMPFNQNKLSACKVSQINKWINDGAPNN
jgi:Planctomycete cytochrome C